MLANKELQHGFNVQHRVSEDRRSALRRTRVLNLESAIILRDAASRR